MFWRLRNSSPSWLYKNSAGSSVLWVEGSNARANRFMRKIAIIQRQIPHYRGAFFAELYSQGRELGFDVTVYSGSPPQGKIDRDYQCNVLPVKRFRRRNGSPCWISGLESAVHGSDIIIAPQELQCLNVPYLWVRRRRLCRCWIWWGHGYNFQAQTRQTWSTSMQENIKNFMTRRGDGLITYTLSGAEYWRQRGISADRVLPYLNTIDVEGLREAGARVTEQQLLKAKQQLGLVGKQVLIFSGRLYAEKKVDFLLRAFALLQGRRTDVALLVLGNGPERAKLEALKSQLQLRHVQFLGEENDPDRVSVFFKLADMLLIPGLVGLAIVHGFAYGLPIATTDHGYHSPEIEYLSSENGVFTPHEENAYAQAIGNVLAYPPRLRSMQIAAATMANRLTLKDSTARFLGAINGFLSPPNTIRTDLMFPGKTDS